MKHDSIKTQRGRVGRVIAVLATLLAALGIAGGLGLASAGQAWADPQTFGGVDWEIADGTLTIAPAQNPESGYQSGEIPSNDNGADYPWKSDTFTSADIRSGVKPQSGQDVSMQGLFYGCSALTSLTLPASFDTSNVTSMSQMFYNCRSLTSLTLPASFDTSNVTNMWLMFANCQRLTSLTLPESFDTGNVTNMASMFGGCSSLEKIYAYSDFDTSSLVASFSSEDMFADCTSLVGGAGTAYDSNHTDASYAKIDGGVSSPGYFTLYTPPAPSYGTIPVRETVHAPESVKTAGITYTVTLTPLSQDAVTASTEPGIEYASVPMGPLTVTLANMDGTGVQVVDDAIELPNPASFPHAGLYEYTVAEAASTDPDTTHWDNSQATYKVRLYVENGIDSTTGNFTGNLVYGSTPYMIEMITDDDGAASVGLDGNDQPTGLGEKVPRLAYANSYVALQDLSVSKNVTGAYADRTFQFPFTVSLELPEYATDTSVAYTLTGGAALNYGQGDTNPNTATDATTGTVAIANHEGSIKVKLADGQGITFSDLPVGTRYSVTEVSSVDGVNTYVPTAEYTYSSTNSTDAGYMTNVNAVANAGKATTLAAGNDQGAMNTQTIVGDAAGNAVVFSNALDNPPSPTGIIMYAAPTVLPLVVLATLAAIGVWRLSRRKELKKDVRL